MTKNQSIKTPILTYEHTERGNRVDLVGMIHVAEPAYYEAIQGFVDRRAHEGAVVHYEGVKRVSKEQFRQAPRQVRQNAALSRMALRDLYHMVSDVDGLVHQGKGITYRKEWKNNDATILDQGASMSRLAVDSLYASTRILKLVNRVVGKEMMHQLLRESLRGIDESDGKPRGIRRIGAASREDFVIRKRNEIAIAALDEELHDNPDTDVLLMWGAGHLPGMSHEVENRGFVQTDEQYLTAIHMQ